MNKNIYINIKNKIIINNISYYNKKDIIVLLNKKLLNGQVIKFLHL